MSSDSFDGLGRHWTHDDYDPYGENDPAAAIRYEPTEDQRMEGHFKVLSGAQFYHGTTHDIEGDTLLPGVKVGKTNWGSGDPHTVQFGGQPASHHVFQTPSEDEAWQWPDSFSRNTEGRKRVLHVEPEGEVFQGIHGNEYLSESSKILDTHWGPPNSQPALPHLNWNQFRPGFHQEDANYERLDDPWASWHEKKAAETSDAEPAPQVRGQQALPIDVDNNPNTQYIYPSRGQH